MLIYLEQAWQKIRRDDLLTLAVITVLYALVKAREIKGEQKP